MVTIGAMVFSWPRNSVSYKVRTQKRYHCKREQSHSQIGLRMRQLSSCQCTCTNPQEKSTAGIGSLFRPNAHVKGCSTPPVKIYHRQVVRLSGMGPGSKVVWDLALQ